MRGYTLHNTGDEVQEVIDNVIDKTVYDCATESEDGLMSSVDKTKLNGLGDPERITNAEMDRLLN